MTYEILFHISKPNISAVKIFVALSHIYVPPKPCNQMRTLRPAKKKGRKKWKHKKKKRDRVVSTSQNRVWKILAEMETVQRRDRPRWSATLTATLGARGAETAVPRIHEPGGRTENCTRVRWSSIRANVRPTRPQFIRHLPSPSALGNCSESFGAREQRRAACA